MFISGETWPSPEGAGAARLSYDLDVPGDGTVSGTIAAQIVFDQPSGFYDFDYVLSANGSK